MKTTAYLKLSGSLIALTAAAVSQAHAQATGWTGGSSYNQDITGAAVTGDNLWHNALNWSNGLPNAATDVSIGLATMQLYYRRYECQGPGGVGDVDWCVDVIQGPRPTSWDIVLLSGTVGNAQNLYIGLSGGRGFQGSSAGPGHLINQSGLVVGLNMTVGETGTGRYDAIGTTAVGGNLVIGGQGIGTFNNDNLLNVGGHLTVGGYAQGTVTNTSTITVGGNITVGQDAQGTLTNSGNISAGGNLTVGGNDQGILTNTNATITIGGDITVGQDAQGTFTTNGNVSAGGNFTVGGNGQGTFTNTNATITVGGDITVGQDARGTFTTNGNVSAGGNLTVGGSGQGTFTNTNATISIGGDITVGQDAEGTFTTNGNVNAGGNLTVGGNGQGTFTNTNATISIGGDISVGQDGQGTLTNTGGTVTSGGDITIGVHGQGTATNTGTMSSVGNFIVGFEAEGNFTNTNTVSVGGNFTVGESGQGTVDNNGAATITVTGNTAIGENAAGIGILNLNDTSRLTTGGSMAVGEHGTGTLNIATGARAETTGRITLGTSVSGVGTVINNGTMINHEQMVVGDMGRGRLHTAAGATTTTTGDVTVGESATGMGFVSVRGRMDNGGRLDIGDHGDGYMVVHDGGRVTNRESVVGREGGGNGYVLVSDATSIWDNAYSLTLGSESESIGVLTINNDGEVQIRQGYGTLTIAEMEGSTGILNIGGLYPPTGLSFPIDTQVATYVAAAPLGQNVNSTAPLAAGTLDAAFVQFGKGAGSVNFNHTETEANDYRFKAGFIGNGQINHYGNFTVLDGDSSLFTGNAHVLGGIMVVNNVFGGHVTVDPAAILRIGHRNGVTGEVLNDIVNNGIVQFYRADTSRYSGVISGVGAVEQNGTGTTILTGENTYTGQTRINAGTLQLGDGGKSGSIDHTSGVVVNANGTLAFNRSDIKVFDRTITGTGTIAQIGTGLTRLTADNSGFTGQTRIDAGTLSVNGRLGGTVEVNDTGTLEGLGQVGTTTVHEGGTIAPGNSTDPNMQRVGRLTIEGNFTQEAGSFHDTDVLSTGQSDLLYVTGTAAISNDSYLKVSKIDPARYELERRYTVLTAEGGVTGDYILIGDTFVSTFYRLEDHYDANNVYLDVAQYRLFPEAGKTPNQIAAATGAQDLKAERDINGYPTNPLFRAIAYLPTDKKARYAFDQISGEIYASLQGAMLDDSHMVRDVMGDRIRSAFGDMGEKIVGYTPGIDIKDPTPQPVYGNDQEGPVIWGRGFGNWGEIEGDGNAAELKRDGRGLFLGADMPFRDMFRVGLLAGYDRTDYKVPDRNSSAASSNYHLGLYGGAEWWRLALQLGASFTWHKTEVAREIVFPGFAETASSEFDGGTAQLYADLGYRFRPAGLPSLQLQPFLGLAYANNKQGGYDEAGGYAALHGGADQSLGTGYGTLGLRAAQDFDLLDIQWTVHGSAAWRRAFSDAAPTATHHFNGSRDFTVFGTPQPIDTGLFKLGVDANLSEHWAMGFSYAGEYSSKVEFHNLRGDLNYKW
ncbi:MULTISPECIES: autotransporter domain-containing protein [Chelativorans]|jgi:T5SS/PEP-CTERM-associated repeat protein|uniref:autotransporter domain-containing protein n=1 Tax=Chelativorans TaxID=449972 RepID=UPI00140C66FF|nr:MULTISPECIES: autotransporter domain-containing protein [Chelativorans]